MILSESEKNRIRGLYGLVTEAETAPPPDESVLVAKKNPFKNGEYNIAARKYSPNMRDGELFTILKPNDKKILDEINSRISGKKVRLKTHDKDTIFTLPKYEKITFNSLYDKYEDWMGGINSIKLISGKIQTYSTIESNIYLGDSYLRNKITDGWNTYEIPHELEKIFDEYEFKNLPDEYFEIRKIQRENTDF
jgi:hypothetical protein